jgi:hypothetical protein
MPRHHCMNSSALSVSFQYLSLLYQLKRMLRTILMLKPAQTHCKNVSGSSTSFKCLTCLSTAVSIQVFQCSNMSRHHCPHLSGCSEPFQCSHMSTHHHISIHGSSTLFQCLTCMPRHYYVDSGGCSTLFQCSNLCRHHCINSTEAIAPHHLDVLTFSDTCSHLSRCSEPFHLSECSTPMFYMLEHHLIHLSGCSTPSLYSNMPGHCFKHLNGWFTSPCTVAYTMSMLHSFQCF